MSMTQTRVQETGQVPGRAEVSIHIAAKPAAVWAALTRAAEVGQWFGDLSASLRPGGRHRLDFGDGDFFELSGVEFSPPDSLRYDWRFLGTGALNRIGWHIDPAPGGVRVTVTDDSPARGADGVAEMVEGWTDFVERLKRYCETGARSRYEWRKEFDAATELPCTAGRALEVLVFAPDGHRWLPWMPSGIAEGLAVSPRDGAVPRSLAIAGLERHADASITFALGCPDWQAPTRCRMQIRPHGDAAMLVVSHNGWDRILPDAAEQRRQRERFSDLWITALAAARSIVEAAERA